ncbi:MAG: sialidase family protein [Gallionella sp.]
MSYWQQQTKQHKLLLLLVAISFAAAFYKAMHHPAPATFVVPVNDQHVGTPKAIIRSHFVSSTQNISTHASSLVDLGNGYIRAFWFAGSREGAKDVQIRTAIFDPVYDRWSPEIAIADRHSTQRDLLRFVKKIGNPVAHRAPDGTLWLFYVTVSIGGWAGSSITAMTSHDDGSTWSAAQRLITSPFINISTLVKGTPFNYSDGSIGLPIYHEFIGKFGELLRLSLSGEVIDKQRLTSGKLAIQPVPLIQNAQNALMLMRHTGPAPKRVIRTVTTDAGQHWSTPQKSELKNPDAAVAGVALSDGRLLAVLNDTETNREVLSLVVSSDNGASWKTVYQLEDQHGQHPEPAGYAQRAAQLAKDTEATLVDASGHGVSARHSKCMEQSCEFEFSYPYMIQAKNSDFHLVYTWNRSFIKHVRFSREWLDQRITELRKEETNAAVH